MEWIILATSLTNFYLGIFVWRRNPNRKLNRYFGILGIIMGLWVFNNFLFRLSPSLFLIRNSYAVGALVPTLSLFWILNLTERKITKIVQLSILTFGTIFFILPHLGGLIIQELVTINFAGYEGVTGPLFNVYSGYVVALQAIIFYQLFRAYRQFSGQKREQIQLVLVGTTIWMVIVLTVSLLLPLVGILEFTSLDSPTSLIFVGFIAYAITRYQLMDIKAIIARTITFGLLVAILTSIYGILSALIGFSFESFYAREANPIFVGAVVAVFIAIGYQPLRSLVARITDRFLFKKAYDADELLGKISEVTSSITNIKTLLEHITQTLNDAFHFEKLAIVLLDENKKLVIAHKEGFNPGVAEALTTYPKAIEILYKEIQQVPGLMVLDEMKTQYENGEFKPASPELLAALLENDLAIIAPLYVNKQLIGVMAIGNKKSGDSYTQQDLSTLRIIAGQSAVGIENARLYNQLKGFNVKLEAEVTKKTAELQKANDELRQLDRAKSEFISIASHQLRTPLTVIKGYISMMQEGSFGKVPPKILENLTKVYASNERLIGLVENLLDISRIESGRQQYEWSKIHLEDLAQTVVENLKQNAKERNLKLILHKLKKKTPEVIVDANKLHEVMMNFVDNALKYTPEGSVDVHVLPEPKGMVTFSVKDTGKGITPDMKDLLFRKFSRGKDSFKLHTEGVGLGLYVAKMLIDQHGGKIWADSEGEGKGSTFSFSIPVKGNEAKLAEQEKAAALTPAKPVSPKAA